MVKTRSQAWVSRPLALAERMTLLWFLVDGITHLTLELSFLWFSCTRTSAGQEGSMLAFPWREYGKADVRWLPQAYDAGICSLEILTVWVSEEPIGRHCFVLVLALHMHRDTQLRLPAAASQLADTPPSRVSTFRHETTRSWDRFASGLPTPSLGGCRSATSSSLSSAPPSCTAD